MSTFSMVPWALLPCSIVIVSLTCSMQYECSDLMASGDIAISACFRFVALSAHLERSVAVPIFNEALADHG